MEVRSDRRWAFDVDAETLWSAIAALDEYRRWWPWLRRFDGRALVAGDTWECLVQPPLPYTLRFGIDIHDVVPHRLVTASVHGDITGTARLELEPDGSGCDVRLQSALAPANGVLKAIARVARPVAQFGHDWVLDTGARQFRARGL